MDEINNIFQEFLGDIFDTITHNLYPIDMPQYWNGLDKSYDRNYEIIKELTRCSKYKVAEFKAQHDFTAVDDFVSCLAPSKTQFDYLKCYMTSQYSLKLKYDSALTHLIRAKEAISECNSTLMTNLKGILQSEILSDSQKVVIGKEI